MNADPGLRSELDDEVWLRLLDDIERQLIAEQAQGPPLRVLEIAPRLGGVATLLCDRHQVRVLDQGETPLSPALTRHRFALPFPDCEDESVDLVLLLGRLEHDEAPAATLAEVRRVLREGGRLVFAVVDPRALPGARPPYPEILSEAALPGLLARHDLLIERLHPWGPKGAEAHARVGVALRALRSAAAEHNRIGVTLFQQGKTGEAWCRFQRAIDLDPSLADALFNRASLQRLGGRPDLFRAGLEAVLRIAPDHPGANAELQRQTSDPTLEAPQALEVAP